MAKYTSAVMDLLAKLKADELGISEDEARNVLQREDPSLYAEQDGGFLSNVGEFLRDPINIATLPISAPTALFTGSQHPITDLIDKGELDIFGEPVVSPNPGEGLIDLGLGTPGGDSGGFSDTGTVNMSAEQREVLSKWAAILDTQNKLLNKQMTETDATREILRKFLPQSQEEIDSIKRLMTGEVELANLSQSEISKIFKAGPGTLESQMVSKLQNLGPTPSEGRLSSALGSAGAGPLERGMAGRLSGMGPSEIERSLVQQLQSQGAGPLESGLAGRVQGLGPTSAENLMNSTLRNMTQGSLERKMISEVGDLEPSALQGAGEEVGLLQAGRLKRALTEGDVSLRTLQEEQQEFDVFKEEMARKGVAVTGNNYEDATANSTPAVQALNARKQRWQIVKDEERRGEIKSGTENLLRAIDTLSGVEFNRLGLIMQGTGLESSIEATRRGQVIQGAQVSSQAQAARMDAYIRGTDVESQASSRRIDSLIRGTGAISDAEAQRMGLYLQGADIESLSSSRRLSNQIQGTSVLGNLANQRTSQLLTGAGLESDIQNRKFNQFNQYSSGIPENRLSTIASVGNYGYPELNQGFNNLSSGYANINQPYGDDRRLAYEASAQEGLNRAGSRSDMFDLAGLLGYGLLTRKRG